MSRIHLFRVLVTHFLYVAYTVYLGCRLMEVVDETNHKDNRSTIASILGLSIVFHAAVQLLICVFALKRRHWSTKQKIHEHRKSRILPFDEFHMRFLFTQYKIFQITWCNVPMLVFILFVLPPYGFTLHHLYEVEGISQKAMLPKGSHTSNYTPVGDKKDVKISMTDYIMLHVPMVILLLAYMLYPFPKRAYVLGEYLAIAIEFMNAFDIMDMQSDIKFVIHYGPSWVALYYASLGTSTVLLAFPIKIEDDTDESNSSTKFGLWKKTIKALFVVIFTDVLFATIRLKIMIDEKSAEYGFNMAVKNIFLAILHFCYLLRNGKKLC